MEDDQTDHEMVLLVLMERAFKGPTHEGVRILDWAPQLKRVLKCVRENDPMTMELRGEIERLRADIERHIAIASEHATECERLRAKLAEANDYINRLRDMLTDSHPCIDPSRDACNCILCELVIRERQQAALAAKEGE